MIIVFLCLQLGATDDPIGDIISCLCADVTAFTAARTYVNTILCIFEDQADICLKDISNVIKGFETEWILIDTGLPSTPEYSSQ